MLELHSFLPGDDVCAQWSAAFTSGQSGDGVLQRRVNTTGWAELFPSPAPCVRESLDQ